MKTIGESLYFFKYCLIFILIIVVKHMSKYMLVTYMFKIFPPERDCYLRCTAIHIWEAHKILLIQPTYSIFSSFLYFVSQLMKLPILFFKKVSMNSLSYPLGVQSNTISIWDFKQYEIISYPVVLWEIDGLTSCTFYERR